MIVMKFGGTSVQDAKAIDRVAHIVQGRLADRPVVVVSAMAKVTDSLLAMGKAAGSGDRKTALKMARVLRERHYDTAGELLGTALFTEFHSDLGADFEDLDELLRGIGAVGEITPRTYDNVASFGEMLSSKIVAAAFVARGLSGVHVDSRQVLLTDNAYMRAVPQFEETNERLRKRVQPLLEGGKVPVMGGFIGSNRAGITTTIGRGGSDFSAAIFGAGLNAERIEIWTDVDGMMTTDPRLCPDARRIKVISFDEAAELAYFGAKVLHPATVLPAVQQNIPVYVLNSLNPTCEGTKVTARAPRCSNIFKAIALKKKITLVEVASPRRLLVHGYLKSIFEAFDRHGVAVDVVSTSEVSVSVTAETTENIPALSADLAKIADVKYEGRKAIVCLVGEKLRETPGIAAKVFGILENVKIRMISQGASEINLTFVIEEDDAAEVVRRLHKAFFAEADPEVFA
ncbi:MAG: lysine-sensitive aspartokinase 3 [Terriglobales bacterium]|jgi:aspartate kinase